MGVGEAGLMRQRLRDERGLTVVEVAVTSGLLLVVLAPMLMGLASAQRREVTAEMITRAVNDGRTAMDRIVAEAREADGLTEIADGQVEVWRDEDDDGVEDAGETAAYEIDGGARVVRRTVGDVSSILVEGIDATSDLWVETGDGGSLLGVRLAVDPGGDAPPEAALLETKVFARDG